MKRLRQRLRNRFLTQTIPTEAGIKAVEVQSAIDLRRLSEEKKIIEAHLTEAREHLDQVKEPEAVRLAKIVHLCWLIPLFLLTLALAIGSNLWGLEAFTSLTQYKRLLIACGLSVLSLIGGVATGTSLRMHARAPLRKITFGIGLILLTLTILATITLNLVRGWDTLLLEQHPQEALTFGEDLGTSAKPETTESSAYTSLGTLFIFASIIMGIAGELGSAFTADQLLFLLTSVWTISRLRHRVNQLENELIQIATDEETARSYPELLRAQASSQIIEIEDERLAPLAWKIILTIALVALLIAGTLTYARAAESIHTHTIILTDLSDSVDTNGEFTKNLLAVEGFIKRLKDSGHQVIILPINQDSFQTSPLLNETAPPVAGRYKEHILRWQKSVITTWRRVSSKLTPSAKCSDHFGAIARAALEFGESTAAIKYLVIFSDMRAACREGFNFEQPLDNPTALVEQVHKKGLIPRLEGVKVWVLGAHTAKIDEQHWNNLKVFWQEFFKRSGAELLTFSPNRRWQP